MKRLYRLVLVGLVAASFLQQPFTNIPPIPHVQADSSQTTKAPVKPVGAPKTVPMANPVPDTTLQPEAPLQPIYVPPAKPATPSGCVTGYVSGDYYLDKIIAYESGGNSCATNSIGCFGLLQACPGQPLRDACGGDPACQIEWFIANKTGGRTWAQVWQHELDYGWW